MIVSKLSVTAQSLIIPLLHLTHMFPHTRPMNTSLIKTCTQERGTSYASTNTPNTRTKISDLKYQTHKNQKIHQRGDYKSIAMIMGGEDHMAIRN